MAFPHPYLYKPPVLKLCLTMLAITACGAVLRGDQTAPISARMPEGSSGSWATAGSPSSSFRSGVDLVILGVTVVDQQQRSVRDLRQDDFAVFENGVQQEVSFFASGPSPIDVAILLDTSSSMVSDLAIARSAATGFVRAMGTDDRVAIIGIHDRAEILHALDGDRGSAVAAIARASAHGATALYNGLYLTIKDMALKRRDSTDVRRQAIVVLSDGQDTKSLLDYDDVRELARESGITIYTILFHAPTAAQNTNFEMRPAPHFVMKSLAQVTGGRPFIASAAVELQNIYSTVANELSNQYTLAYTSKNVQQDGTFRQVRVRVSEHPHCSARTRDGYRAAATSTPERTAPRSAR